VQLHILKYIFMNEKNKQNMCFFHLSDSY
jgi:hypothetical protein